MIKTGWLLWYQLCYTALTSTKRRPKYVDCPILSSIFFLLTSPRTRNASLLDPCDLCWKSLKWCRPWFLFKSNSLENFDIANSSFANQNTTLNVITVILSAALAGLSSSVWNGDALHSNSEDIAVLWGTLSMTGTSYIIYGILLVSHTRLNAESHRFGKFALGIVFPTKQIEHTTALHKYQKMNTTFSA